MLNFFMIQFSFVCLFWPSLISHRENQLRPFTRYCAQVGRLLRDKAALFAQQETVLVAVTVNVLSRDVAARVDIIQIRGNGSRKIDGSKGTLAQQKAMIVAAA